LFARLRALTRRSSDVPKSPVLTVANLSLDPTTHRVNRQDKSIDLPAKEFAMLECLMRSAGQVLTRTQIAEHIWSYDTYNQSNVVDVYIRNLRRKIDDDFEPKLLHTIRGVGYRLSEESDEV
jgi:DNA-binding response OmpR family regulator